MTRTNIEIDDELIKTVMEQNSLTSKRAAVEYALTKAVRRTPAVAEILALEGIGFLYTNDEIEGDEPDPWA